MDATEREKSFLEFFAGIGLVRDALQRQNWRCVYANDIDPKKREMYAAHFGESEHFQLGDIWDTQSVVGRIRGRVALATASFPCTDMSLAGNMRGFRGDESSAFFGFVEVLRALGDRLPCMVLLENVTGFLNSRGGEDFRAATCALGELGYWLDAFIIDAKWFVPQSRPRLFVIGFHESISSPLLIRKDPEPGLFEDDWRGAVDRAAKLRPHRLLNAIESAELKTGWVAIDTGSPKQRTYKLEDVIETGDDEEWWNAEQVHRHYQMMSDRHRRQVDALLRSEQELVATVFRRVRQGEQRAEVRSDGVAGCLRTPRGGSAKQIVIAIRGGELRMRWMSPREYARLQGAGDYTLPSNVIQALYGFGDAVCVPVVRWIDERMLTPVFDSMELSTLGNHGRFVLA